MNCLAAPYPADTKAKGWRFELDLEQVRQSDTWAIAAPAIRPWLLMLWATAWEQMPCGSLPNDDALIAARIGMDAKAFSKAREVLMRGWWLADDGRLYHDTITARVQAMLVKKDKDRQRKAGWRARQSPGQDSASHNSHMHVTRDNHGTDAGRTPESDRSDDTKHQAPSTSTKTPPSEVAASRQSAAPPTPPPPFDGNNAEALNGKAIVTLADAWELPEAWGNDAEALGWKAHEILREAERFRQYWTQGKGKGTRRSVKGWRQSWSNWLGKAEKDRR